MEELSLTSNEMGEAIARVRSFKDKQKRSPQEIAEEIANVAISQGVKEDVKYYVGLHALFTDKIMSEWIQEPVLTDTLKYMVEKDGEKGQCWTILALQRLMFKTYPTLAARANDIMNCLYNEGILTQETLLKYFDGENQTATEKL
jgi:hypothetical protein